MFLSKRPEYYEKRINSRNVYDPLIVNAGLPPNVQMKKSKWISWIIFTHFTEIYIVNKKYVYVPKYWNSEERYKNKVVFFFLRRRENHIEVFQ